MHYLRERYLAESAATKGSVDEAATSMEKYVQQFGMPELMPKKLAAFYVKELKKIRPKPESVTVRKAEATLPVGGSAWDFGVYVIIDVKFEDEKIGIGFMVHVATDQNPRGAGSNGTAQADHPYGMLASKMGKDGMQVAKMLVGDVRDHLSKVKQADFARGQMAGTDFGAGE